jgi:SAM-dependent methyltransferase
LVRHFCVLLFRTINENGSLICISRDNVEWDDEQEEHAKTSVAKNSVITLSETTLLQYENEADKHWDAFYDQHQNKFFKDRHWLFTEFPELAPNQLSNVPERVFRESEGEAAVAKPVALPQTDDNSVRTIFEIGCGVGNTVFPILKYDQSSNLMVYASDFSSHAISILKESPEYDQKRCQAFVLDGTNEKWDVPFEENSLDIIVLIFVLSAIHPDK